MEIGRRSGSRIASTSTERSVLDGAQSVAEGGADYRGFPLPVNVLRGSVGVVSGFQQRSRAIGRGGLNGRALEATKSARGDDPAGNGAGSYHRFTKCFRFRLC